MGKSDMSVNKHMYANPRARGDSPKDERKLAGVMKRVNKAYMDDFHQEAIEQCRD